MAHDHHYPELCLECIRELIEIIRNNQIQERTKEFALDAWVTAGMVLNLAVGEPEEIEPFTADPEIMAALKELDSLRTSNGGVEPIQAGAGNWIPLVIWLLKLLIEQLGK